MKILLVNGSPRRQAASSRIVLDKLRSMLGESHEYRMAEPMADPEAQSEDLDVDFIILAFPLYIDSLHSRLLAWLLSYQELRSRTAAGSHPIGMIAVANCGFHEGVQNKSALGIVENFCVRAGIEWRGGLGIGAGEMIRELKDAPDGMVIKRPISQALGAMAARLGDSPASVENLYVSPAFPRFLFKLVAHASWRKAARQNGIGRFGLLARPFKPIS